MNETLRPRVSLLTDEQVDHVIDQALAVLGRVGVRVEHDGALGLLTAAGQRVRDGRVLLDEEVVRRAAESAPARFAVYDRDGAVAMDLGSGQLYFDPGSSALVILDGQTHQRRKPTVDDCVHMAWITEACAHLAAQSTALVPADVPEAVADRHRLYVALVHGRKPVITGTFTRDALPVMRDMLVAIRGSSGALRERPLAIVDCCPTAPLSWPDLTCEALVACARAGIPAQLVSMPIGGATAPVTLREMVVQHAAECLAGAVIHQLAAPGAPLIWGGSPAVFDMRHGTTPMGAIETMMVDVACAQVGRRLGLPTQAYMALSDSKGLDWQAGMETGCGAVLAALAGIDVVSGPGMLDFESCQSLEKLVLDDQLCAMALRLTRGIGHGSAGEAVELLGDAVRRGDMLGHPHTRGHFRDELLLPGPVIARAMHGDWEAAGARDSFAAARAEVQRLLAQGAPAPLPAEVARDLYRIVAEDAQRHGLPVPLPSV